MAIAGLVCHGVNNFLNVNRFYKRLTKRVRKGMLNRCEIAGLYKIGIKLCSLLNFTQFGTFDGHATVQISIYFARFTASG